MATGVDPKNASQRENPDTSFFDRFRGLLPSRFYFKEFAVILALLGVGYIGYDFTQYVRNSKRYQVSVTVNGLKALSEDAVLGEIDQFIGTPEDPKSLVNVSVTRVRSALVKAIPRFKSVEVRKDYPGTLIIEVEERDPVALVARRNSQGESRVFLPVSRDGVVFRPTTEEVETLPNRVPVVKGFPEVKEGTPSFQRKWKKALTVLDEVDRKFSSDLLEWVQVRTGGYVQVKINHPKELKIRLGENQFEQKLTKLKEMMQTNQFLDIKKYVNLTQLENVRAL